MRYIIVGIDPGKTVGVACLDLRGNIIFSAHYKNMRPENIIEEVAERGTPIIVAGDKKRPSELVRKINASFGARIFSPKREFSAELKREFGREVLIKNPHERDAYTAALIAYNSYSNKFKQVEHKTSELGRRESEERVKRDVVLKRSIFESITGRRANRN